VFGLFFSLLIVCSLRGMGMMLLVGVRHFARSYGEVPVPARLAIPPPRGEIPLSVVSRMTVAPLEVGES